MLRRRVRLKDWLVPLNNLRLRYKILLLSVSLVVLSTSITGFYSYHLAAGTVTEQAYAQSRETVTQAANFLDEKLRNLIWLSYFLQTDPAVRRILTSPGGSYATQLSDVQSPLAAFRMREQTVHSVLIATPSGDYHETVNIPNQAFRKSDLYMAAAKQQGFTWFPTHPDELFRGAKPSLTLVLPVNVPETVKDSFIVVNLSADWFEQYLNGVSPGRDDVLILADPNGLPVFPPRAWAAGAPLPDLTAIAGPSRRGAAQTLELAGKTPLILNQAAVPAAGWRLVLVQPRASLLSGARQIRVAAMMVMALALVISGVLSFWLAASIAKPLDVLRKLMRAVEQRNFSSTFNARYDDEVGDLGRAFNRMTGRLDELMTQVETEQRLKRHAELRALQAQMSPHFLYNTLDSIYWRAQLKEHQTVSEMVVALSRLLRLGLNKGEEITTVRRELEHTETYLLLQKRNYEQQFAYAIKAEPACLDFPCPKLILQPIVENSLLHGFAGLTAGGLITVTAAVDGDRVVLTVQDNGCGPPAEADGLPQGGYALKNVQERIRLHFGPGYGLRMERAPDGGARVIVTVPGGASDLSADAS